MANQTFFIPGVGFIGLELNDKGQKLVRESTGDLDILLRRVAKGLTVEEIQEIDEVMERADKVNPGIKKVWLAIRPGKGVVNWHKVNDQDPPSENSFEKKFSLKFTRYVDVPPLGGEALPLSDALEAYATKSSLIAAFIVSDGGKIKLIRSFNDADVPKSVDSKGYSDNAMISSMDALIDTPKIEAQMNPGGIDLNSAHVKMNVEREDGGFILPKLPDPHYNITIDGLIPVIINVVPIPNVLNIIGLPDKKNEDVHLSHLTRP